jgi:hypothetical protein
MGVAVAPEDNIWPVMDRREAALGVPRRFLGRPLANGYPRARYAAVVITARSERTVTIRSGMASGSARRGCNSPLCCQNNEALVVSPPLYETGLPGVANRQLQYGAIKVDVELRRWSWTMNAAASWILFRAVIGQWCRA